MATAAASNFAGELVDVDVVVVLPPAAFSLLSDSVYALVGDARVGQPTRFPIHSEIGVGMAGRSAHVRRVSTNNEARPTVRRRSSSQGDTTPRLPAPAGLAMGTPVPGGGALGLLSPPTEDTYRGGSVSQPHSPTAPTFSQSLGSHANSTTAAIGQAKGDQAAGEAQSTGQHQPSRRLGFLALGDMLQSSAGLLATSTHSHSHSPASHATHLAAAAHTVLAATSLLSAAAPHYRSITSPIPSSLLPTRTHSRPDAAPPIDRAHSPAPPSGAPMATSPPPPSKGHTSPSKVCLLSQLDSCSKSSFSFRTMRSVDTPWLYAPQ